MSTPHTHYICDSQGNPTPQFHCDVDPEDYITAEVTESNTVLLKTLQYYDINHYHENAIELDLDNLRGLIFHLQYLQSLISSQDS